MTEVNRFPRPIQIWLTTSAYIAKWFLLYNKEYKDEFTRTVDIQFRIFKIGDGRTYVVLVRTCVKISDRYMLTLWSMIYSASSTLTPSVDITKFRIWERTDRRIKSVIIGTTEWIIFVFLTCRAKGSNPTVKCSMEIHDSRIDHYHHLLQYLLLLHLFHPESWAPKWIFSGPSDLFSLTNENYRSVPSRMV